MWRRALTAVLIVAFCGAAFGGEPKWEPQLREMGYLFLHMSNINVINGLNLTREQAVKLHRLARQMEAVAPRPPSLRTPLSPELEEVRKTWLEARKLLLEGKPVPEELEKRVNQARVSESRVIRTTIRPRPIAMDSRCISCHTKPQSGAVEPMTVTPRLKRLVDRGHMEGIYGKRGIWKLVQLAPKVEAILTEGQRDILGSFACCIVPPQDLTNPMRAGQAEGSEKALALMRKIRQCPANFWPLMRAGILKRVEQLTHVVSPGATATRKATTRESVAKTLDRVRKLSDVEFELEKDNLGKAVKAAIMPPQADSPYKAAYFLLIPGSSKVYATYIKRLARGERASAR